MSPMAANTLIAMMAFTPAIVIRQFDQGFIERLLREVLFHLSKLCAKTVEFSSMAKDDAALVLGERLSL